MLETENGFLRIKIFILRGSSMHVKTFGHVIGGAFLIAGTTIGVGMLALPVATAQAGFFPSVALYMLCWLFMLCTGLLTLEVCIWMPQDANFITMSRILLGRGGQAVVWIVYLFLFITVMIAHVAGGGDILQQIVGDWLPPWVAKVIYVALFAPVVYLGARTVDRFNLVLMAGLIISYFIFVIVAAPHIKMDLLARSNWAKVWWALPILFTAFTFQVIIPTLMSYMKRNVKKVRLAIFIGTTIPLGVYLLWQFLILGIVPAEGEGSLREAAKLGQNAVMPLKTITHSPYLFNVGKSFAFFTLTASFLALALAFVDFLADGLKVDKSAVHKLWLCLLVFVPPTVIALTYPHIFLIALSYAGGFSCAILFGLLPPVMTWVGRHVYHYHDDTRQLFGGKFFLTLLIIFVTFELAIEIADQFVKGSEVGMGTLMSNLFSF